MATFNFPTAPAVGNVNAAGQYSGPASGLAAWQVHNSPLVAASAAAAAARDATTTLGAAPAPDTALLQSITSDIGSLNAEAAANAANATASTTQAAGYAKEIEAYNTVGAIAGENANIEGVAGNIKQLQANRAVNRTIGSQRAAVASAGFASSGSSLDIMKSSLQEGYLNDQIIRTQTSVAQGGYLEQGAAAQADAAGAGVASDAALSLSKSYAAAGQLATANAANETAALNSYLATNGPITPSEQLVTSTLAADPTKPTTFPTVNPTTTATTPRAPASPFDFGGAGRG